VKVSRSRLIFVVMTVPVLIAFRVESGQSIDTGQENDRSDDSGVNASLIFPIDVAAQDDRVKVTNPRQYPYSKYVVFVMGRPDISIPRRSPSASVGDEYHCSGTLLDADHVLTAAHCVYNRPDQHWAYSGPSKGYRPATSSSALGTDVGKGYVCLGGPKQSVGDFQEDCEFVSSRFVPADFQNLGHSLNGDDYAVLKLRRDNHPNGLGAGRWVALSTLNQPSKWENRVPIIHQYPAEVANSGRTSLVPNGGAQTLTAGNDTYLVQWRDQFVGSGVVDSSTTMRKLRHKVDTGGGSSGSSIIYYVDDATSYTGQAHYLIGVNTGAENIGSPNARNLGPSVRAFRMDIDRVVGNGVLP